MKSKSNPDSQNTVEITKDDSIVSIFCNCANGQYGGYCYHKEAFFTKDESCLLNRDQLGTFSNAATLVARSKLKTMYDEFQNAEAVVMDAKKTAKGLKNRLARAMRDGT